MFISRDLNGVGGKVTFVLREMLFLTHRRNHGAALGLLHDLPVMKKGIMSAPFVS